MGLGDYSHEAHLAISAGRARLPPQDVFKQRECHALMNPKGVRVRESRDSADHPSSLGIVFALDVTGSMGHIPQLLAKEQLPKFMKILTACKVPDPQLLFMAVGDATCDRAPLQVGQFESTADLMDKWLTWSYLEGGGGGSMQESYELAMYFLAQHTEMDCQVKRGKRGYMFMTGDELPYPSLSRHTVDAIIGDRLDDDLKVEEIVAELQNTFVPFFLIPDQTRRARCERPWRDLLGDHVLCLSDPEDVCYVSAGAVLLGEGIAADLDAVGRAFTLAGVPRARVNPSVRALTSFAEAPVGRVGPALASRKPGVLKWLFGASGGK